MLGDEEVMGLATVDASGRERGDVSIPSVFSQRRAVLPELHDRIVEAVEVAKFANAASTGPASTEPRGAPEWQLTFRALAAWMTVASISTNWSP